MEGELWAVMPCVESGVIPESKVEAAVKHYRDIAEGIGEMYGNVWYLDHKRKIVRSELFNEAEGTVAQREA